MGSEMCIRDSLDSVPNGGRFDGALGVVAALEVLKTVKENGFRLCLLYTSDAADERSSVDLGGRRIIKKKKKA